MESALGGGGSHKLLALLKDTAGLLPLLGIAHADLVEDVEEHVGVDDLELSVLAEGGLASSISPSSSSTKLTILSPENSRPASGLLS